ncbi:hypothetical protein Gorai_003219, partial [Gossypium raimondii]|nr:hypothetical protein [Gossypium raimondii]
HEHSSILGIIFRDSGGYILVACTYPNNFVADATTNEARACLHAVTMAEKLGFQMLVVEGDSLTVVKKFRSLREERSKRLVNQRAHAMVMERKQWSLLRVWIEEAPLRVEVETANLWEQDDGSSDNDEGC